MRCVRRSARKQRYNLGVSSPRVARAAARHSLPIRIFRLGAEPSDDLSGSTTPEQRLAMMWPLALEAWSVSGRPLPRYARDGMQIYVVRTPSRPRSG